MSDPVGGRDAQLVGLAKKGARKHWGAEFRGTMKLGLVGAAGGLAQRAGGAAGGSVVWVGFGFGFGFGFGGLHGLGWGRKPNRNQLKPAEPGQSSTLHSWKIAASCTTSIRGVDFRFQLIGLRFVLFCFRLALPPRPLVVLWVED